MDLIKYQLVMLIDDSEIDNLVNKHILQKNKIAESIVVHTSAISALEFFKSTDIPLVQIPELILLDINMPIMNGFDFLQHFELLIGNFKKPIKIIMLTSSVDPNDIKRSEESKLVSGFISKPLSIELLQNI